MATFILFAVLQLLVLYSDQGDAVRCFECSSVPSPISCGDITTCEDSESCFLEQVVTTSGNVVYNSGCETNSRCSSLNGRRSLTQRSSDIVTCRECCSGNHCNNRGCGIAEVARPQRGVYCYNCPFLTDPAACESVSICASTEKCITHVREEFVGLQEETVYNSECEHIPACIALEVLGKAHCCDTDFCNDFYNKSLNTKPVTPAPTNAPTAAPTEAPTDPPTNPPVTSKPSGHHCDTSGGYHRFTLRNNEEFCVKIFGHERKNWLQAKVECERDHARLVVTDTHEKIHTMQSLVSSSNHENFWIGLWDRNGNDRFYWINDVVLTDSDWGTHPQQPTHVYSGKDEDCVYIYRTDEWHDTWCSHNNGYICERV